MRASPFVINLALNQADGCSIGREVRRREWCLFAAAVPFGEQGDLDVSPSQVSDQSVV